MTFDIAKSWKEFNISIPLLSSSVATIAGSNYCGCSSGADLKLHFLEEPTQQVKDDIDALWTAIDVNHAVATGYIAAADIAADVAAKKASGLAKLIALGLTEAEAEALVG